MEEQEFLKQIVQSPLDDEPRLVYADWLEERGDPRAEFIRVQCSLASDDLSEEEQERLKSRERELLTTHQADWLKELPEHTNHHQFIRGMVGHVSMTMAAFIDRGWQVCRRIPLQSVSLSHNTGQMREFIECPWLRQIKAIRFSGRRIASESFSTFAACKYLGNLRCLSIDVASPRLSRNDIVALRNPFSITQLDELSIARANISEKLLCLLTSADCVRGLKSLSLGQTETEGDFISSAAFYYSLQHLNIRGSQFAMNGDTVMRRLNRTGGPLFPHLRSLTLDNMSVGNQAFIEFIQSHRFRKMRKLSIARSTINDEGAFVLASSSFFAQLAELSLVRSEMSIEGLVALAQSPHRRSGAVNYLSSDDLPAEHVLEFQRQYGTFGHLQ